MSARESLLPPGVAEQITARRVVVLAPHYDDETLGCGGLLLQLGASGAEVQVVFLSDGSGGVEPVDDPVAYSRRRRREAEAAAALLGIAAIDDIGIPDGSLADHRRELTAAIRARLHGLAPDLVLLPSPLEVTTDHRVVFAALHDLLHPLQPGDGLHAALARTRFLLYELNHPQYPDLLVDVSEQMDMIAAATRCYASQLERHPYLAAALGLRCYRTHTLSPVVAGAEAYRTLQLADFARADHATLVAELGGSPEMLPV